MSHLTPTTVVDKNGKTTTVHKKNEASATGVTRIASLPTLQVQQEQVAVNTLFTAEILSIATYMDELNYADRAVEKIQLHVPLNEQSYISNFSFVQYGVPVARCFEEGTGSWQMDVKMYDEEQKPFEGILYDEGAETVFEPNATQQKVIDVYLEHLTRAAQKSKDIQKRNEISGEVYPAGVYLISPTGSDIYGVFADDTTDGSWRFHPATDAHVQQYKSQRQFF